MGRSILRGTKALISPIKRNVICLVLILVLSAVGVFGSANVESMQPKPHEQGVNQTCSESAKAKSAPPPPPAEPGNKVKEKPGILLSPPERTVQDYKSIEIQKEEEKQQPSRKFNWCSWRTYCKLPGKGFDPSDWRSYVTLPVMAIGALCIGLGTYAGFYVFGAEEEESYFEGPGLAEKLGWIATGVAGIGTLIWSWWGTCCCKKRSTSSDDKRPLPRRRNRVLGFGGLSETEADDDSIWTSENILLIAAVFLAIALVGAYYVFNDEEEKRDSLRELEEARPLPEQNEEPRARRESVVELGANGLLAAPGQGEVTPRQGEPDDESPVHENSFDNAQQKKLNLREGFAKFKRFKDSVRVGRADSITTSRRMVSGSITQSTRIPPQKDPYKHYDIASKSGVSKTNSS